MKSNMIRTVNTDRTVSTGIIIRNARFSRNEFWTGYMTIENQIIII